MSDFWCKNLIFLLDFSDFQKNLITPLEYTENRIYRKQKTIQKTLLDSAKETAREQKNRAAEAGSEVMQRTEDAFSNKSANKNTKSFISG